MVIQMPDKKEKTAMTVRFTPAEHREVRKRLADDGIKFQTVAHGFFEEWLRGERKANLRQVSRYAKEIALLEAILEHGTPAEKDSLRAVLKSAAESMQGRRNPSAGPVQKAR
jgi:hypothetical protein